MRLFHGKDINAQVTSFNDTILSIFKNYVPNKYITIDEKDLVQKNDTIKAKIKTKTYSSNNTYSMRYLRVTLVFLKP